MPCTRRDQCARVARDAKQLIGSQGEIPRAGTRQLASRRRAGVALRHPRMGSGLPGTVRGVLAGARQRILGRHLRRHRLPAGARCVAAQGLVPHGRHRHRCDRGGRAQRPVSAEPRRLPARSCTVGRRLRLGRDAVAQLRVLRRRHVRFHRGDHRRQRTWRGRGRQRRCLQPRCRARRRDLHRHRVRRRRPRQHRPRRHAPAAGNVARQPVGRCRRWPDACTTVAGLHAGRVADGAPATGHAGLRPQHSDRPGGRRDLEHAVPPACHPGRGRQPVRRTWSPGARSPTIRNSTPKPARKHHECGNACRPF